MKYKEFCEEIARKANALIMNKFENGFEKYEKGTNDIVTTADTAVNALVIQEIAQAYPDHDVLGEEESSMKNNSEYVWICDPICGTIPFSQKIPTMGFMLALTHNGRPIAAVVSLPATHTVVYAEQGAGCYVNGERTRTTPTNDFGHVTYTDWPTAPHRLRGVYDALTDDNLNVADFGSMPAPATALATGTLSGLILTALSVYDGVAVDLVVIEAGGVITDFLGEIIDYQKPMHGIIAASDAAMHQRLFAIVQNAQ